MKSIGQLHTQYFNRKYGRTGALWDGRYHSFVVHSERYLFNCYRYVEQNPVRARLAVRPADYVWSSYRINTQSGPRSFITPHPAYMELGSTDSQRAAAYQELVEAGLEECELAHLRLAVRSGQLPP